MNEHEVSDAKMTFASNNSCTSWGKSVSFNMTDDPNENDDDHSATSVDSAVLDDDDNNSTHINPVRVANLTFVDGILGQGQYGVVRLACRRKRVPTPTTSSLDLLNNNENVNQFDNGRRLSCPGSPYLSPRKNLRSDDSNPRTSLPYRQESNDNMMDAEMTMNKFTTTSPLPHRQQRRNCRSNSMEGLKRYDQFLMYSRLAA